MDVVKTIYFKFNYFGEQDNKTNHSSSERRGSRRGTFGHDGGSYHRASDFFSRRMASSAVSLHLPSTSGHKKEPLSAHRSHEEIGRRKSHHESTSRENSRYHSAPSVIDEVLHRRDWERSTRELHIPLRPEAEILSASSGSPEAPRAEPESSSLEDHNRSQEQIVGRTCKKHHTNIKSSKKKERQAEDDKDCDATESNFYIGDNDSISVTNSPRNERTTSVINSPQNERSISDTNSPRNESHISVTNSPRNESFTSAMNSPRNESFTSAMNSPRNKSESAMTYPARKEDVREAKLTYRAKEAKQSFNESIRSKERPRQTLVPLEEHQPRTFGFCLDDVIDQLESLDRSGAMHHSIESRISLSKPPFPPPSVEAVGYEGGACYLAEQGDLRAPAATGLRARHASDGDILAPPQRPESGAFSESDLDLELEDEEPPPYDQLVQYRPPAAPPKPDRKETAI